ncbi:HAD family hydrolase [uncultured Intestinimonas sp.]|uniref:HAD family hydrolase n=1 Tax=uncultured Intestinimonas sp. TaxID=1689265 RepID=UPI0025E8DF46|nr:HAD family hydrolase [uncultured Intestinimonas sp.]
MKKRLLVCDMDHTLLDESSRLSRENLEAIRAHVARGGLFTVATGRAPAAIRVFPELLPCINLPVVTGNGGQLVDLAGGDKVLRSWVLPPEVRPLMAEVLERFPELGAVAYYGLDGFCSFRVTPLVEGLIEKERRPALPCTTQHSPWPWNKTLMTGEHDALLEVRQWLDPRLPGLGRTVFSEDTYLEILPLGVSKGAALSVLLEWEGIHPEEVVAIGDAPNDRELLELAGTGVAVANAAPELKAVADAVVCSNEEHAVRACLERFFP